MLNRRWVGVWALAAVLEASAPAMATASEGTQPYSGLAIALPGTVNAQDYDRGGEGVAYHDTAPTNAGGAYRGEGVDLQSSSDGGHNIGWIAAGEWVNYTVTVSTAGAYTVQLRVASPGGGGSLHVGFNRSNVWDVVAVPQTGAWQTYTTVTMPVTLTAGQQILTLLFDAPGFNISKIIVTSGSGGPPSSGLAPFGGAAWAVPGTIQAEDFDEGGEGVAYHDSTSGNSGGQYRSTGVDIEASAGGGYNVGWAGAGEYLNYTVQVGSAGAYTVQLRVASTQGGTLWVGFNGPSNVWKAIPVAATGGWQAWTTIEMPATLGAGRQVLTLYIESGGVNLDRVRVTRPEGPGPGTVVSTATWNIQINDGSEAHARLAIDALMAIGPRPQIVTIQEAYSNHFSVYLDELTRQTGQQWRGVFATHCGPGDWNGTACRSGWYQGVGIFTTFDIIDSGSLHLPFADCWTSARVALRATLNIAGTATQVFTTHLQTGTCTNASQARASAMTLLKGWAGNYGAPQLLAGDFNDEPEIIDTPAGMRPAFVDTWPFVGTGPRVTAYGPTPTLKRDYWFTDSSMRAVPAFSQVVYGTQSISDHYPVQTTFSIR